MLRATVRFLVRLLFRVRVIGSEHYQATQRQADGRTLIVANHTSFIDGLLLTVFVPDRLCFAVNTQIAEQWWARLGLFFVDFVTLDTSRPFALRSLVSQVRQGRKVVVFPEGRITLTGTLMKVYPGSVLVVDHADAQILPVSIDGAQYSRMSRMRGRIQRRWFPQIKITFQAPRRLQLASRLCGRDRRDQGVRQLARMMEEVVYYGRREGCSLMDALVSARTLAGGRALALDDIDRRPYSYDRLIETVILLARDMRVRNREPGAVAALLLPNTAPAVISVLAAFYARIPIVILDTTESVNHVRDTCRQAGVDCLYTARRFTEMSGTDFSALAESVDMVYLEDVRDSLNVVQRLSARLQRLLLQWRLLSPGRDSNQSAACLLPVKPDGHGQLLRYEESMLLARCRQVTTRLDVGPHDVVMNPWPLHNPYSLVAGLFLPLTNGASLAVYPSAAHHRIVPEMAYEFGATILLADSDSLAGYRQLAHPYDFYATRFAFVAGQLPAADEVDDWLQRFGVRLFGSLGSMEAGSVVALNTPLFHRAGSFGRLLPGLDFRLAPEAGLPEGSGRLCLRGAGLPGLDPAAESVSGQELRWVDTGRVVRMDEDGYLWPA